MKTEEKVVDPNLLSSHEGNWHVLVFGLPLAILNYTLGSGLSICRLNSLLSVFDLAAAGAAGFREWAVLEPMTRGCVSEIESAKDSAITPGYSHSGRAWLASALVVLRGYTRHLCVAISSYSWNLVAGITERNLAKAQSRDGNRGEPEKLPSFKGGLLDYHVRFLTDGRRDYDQLDEPSSEWVRRHFEVANRLASQHEGFRFSLEAVMDWRYQSEPRSAVARIWSGLETFFGVQTEVAYRVSIGLASLLQARGPARKAKFKAVRELYDLRSKIVHGDPVESDKLFKALADSYDLLREMLILTIERGAPFTKQEVEDVILT